MRAILDRLFRRSRPFGFDAGGLGFDCGTFTEVA
jgi:hypothetical protein